MSAANPRTSQVADGGRTALDRWVAQNPMACAGLWFAGAAGLLSAQALPILPGLVAEARTLDGLAAWQVGAVALGHVYLSPGLLALVTGGLLGAHIVVPGFADGWAAAARGGLIAATSTLAWVLMAAALIRFTSARAQASVIQTPPGTQEVVAVILVAFLSAVAIPSGAAAGYLLHALFDGSGPHSSTREETGDDAESRLEVRNEKAQEW